MLEGRKGHDGWQSSESPMEGADGGASEMGRNGWVGRMGGEMSMTGKDEEQGHAVVQNRS